MSKDRLIYRAVLGGTGKTMKRVDSIRIRLEKRAEQVAERDAAQHLIRSELAKSWHVANDLIIEHNLALKERAIELDARIEKLSNHRNKLITKAKQLILQRNKHQEQVKMLSRAFGAFIISSTVIRAAPAPASELAPDSEPVQHRYLPSTAAHTHTFPPPQDQ